MSSQVIPSDHISLSFLRNSNKTEIKILQVVIEFTRIGEIGK